MAATNPDRTSDAWARGVLWGSCALAFGLRLWFGLFDHGLYWPDEIYQSLEPAHRLVYGHGLLAWEFEQGARNWALPGFIAGLLWLAKAVGLDHPDGYLPFVRVAFAAVAAGTVYAVHRLARALGAPKLAAAAGASLFALPGPILYFGHRALSETASALPVALGFALCLEALDRDRPRARLLIGASLLGLAVLLRLHNAIFCLGLLGILAQRRRWNEAGWALAALAGWAFAYGLLDRLTWGGWFHSALLYLRFNLIEGKAAQWGTAPFWWYADVLWRCMPSVAFMVAAGAVASAKRATGLALTALAFFVLHAWTPHKELRFLLPLWPVACALFAVGLAEAARVMDGRWLRAGAAVAVVAALASGLSAGSLTFGQLGAYEKAKPNQSAWGDFADVNRLLLRASRLPDLCGLKLEGVHQAWSGGQTYLHQPAPFYPHNGPPRQSGHFNYVIGPGGPGEVVAQEGRLALRRIRQGCVPDGAYSSRLP